jgi:hypothetical protein
MLCPACRTQCDDTSTFCQTCGHRVAGGRIPWLLIGYPAAILLLVALAAIVALALKHVG